MAITISWSSKCPAGSWDLEALASGFAMPCWETFWNSLVLATLWVCLVVSVSGLKQHAWFLVAIGGIGMLQNIYAAGVSRDPATAGLHLTPSSRAPTISGRRGQVEDDADCEVDIKKTIGELNDPSAGLPAWLKPAEPEGDGFRYGTGVQGTLIELEKWVPSAGAAHVAIFFPSSPEDCEDRARDNIHKKFWKRALATKMIRRKANEKWRKE